MNKKTLTFLGISLTLTSCSDKNFVERPMKPIDKTANLIVENNRALEKWRKQLDHLAKSPSPTELKMGAMCYDMMMPYAESYDCNKCKEKTLFAEGSKKRYKAGELKGIREQVSKLTNLGLEVKLDSSCLCSNCGEGDDFYWEISNAGVTIRTKYDSFDFYILRDFLKKKNIVTRMTDHQTPLKKYIPRLKELLLGEKPSL